MHYDTNKPFPHAPSVRVRFGLVVAGQQLLPLLLFLLQGQRSRWGYKTASIMRSNMSQVTESKARAWLVATWQWQRLQWLTPLQPPQRELLQ
ncbi:unnamed protein product [Protopolystoma xenopodis]|uniref:Uncharacterized protein n=1 Tax=Protopolystoma xenopodis TaxID=117903 RepID=A0A448WMW4_9PLAT|nr:unnamed protein product [Protopolystoma xenopodis]